MRTPLRGQQECASDLVRQAICKLTGIAINAVDVPRTVSASRMAWPPRRTPLRLFPDQSDRALATFLLKILMPGFFLTCDRPDQASRRKAKKVGDFALASSASPAESSPTCHTPRR